MNLLITGATGYIGKNLISELKKNKKNSFLIPFRDKYKLDKDLIKNKNQFKLVHLSKKNDYSSLKKNILSFKPYLVIHLATHYIHEHNNDNDINNLIDSNINFSTKILEYSITSGCKKFIFTSTVWKDFHNSSTPVNLYAATKNAFEEIVKFYQKFHNLQAIHIYLSDTYGEFDNRKKLVPLLIKNFNSKKKIFLHPGNNLMEILHIDDVIDIYNETINFIINKKMPFNHFFYPKGEILSLKRLIKIFVQNSNSNLKIQFNKINYRKNEVMHPSKKKSTIKLNWKRKHNFTSTIKSIFSNL